MAQMMSLSSVVVNGQTYISKDSLLAYLYASAANFRDGGDAKGVLLATAKAIANTR